VLPSPGPSNVRERWKEPYVVNTLAEFIYGPDWRRSMQEYATIKASLLTSEPFQSSRHGVSLQEDHIWDVRQASIQHECVSRLMLESAIIEAITKYREGQAELEREPEDALGRTKDAMNWIDAILVAFYPRQKKLELKCQDIAKAVLSVSSGDYAKLGDFKRRREKWLKDRLTRSMVMAFHQFDPLQFTMDGIFCAVAKILETFEIEMAAYSDNVVDRLKKRWYALYHPRSGKTS
jgi:hypothetical protein